MKKKLIKTGLVALLAMGGIFTTPKLYSQSESAAVYNEVRMTYGYYDKNGTFIVTGYGICCGSGNLNCTPYNCQ